MEKNSGLKKYINQIKDKEAKKIIKKADDKKEAEKKIKKILIGAFTAAAYPALFNYPFRDSFIFNSGVILYICNRRFRFQDFR